MLSRFASWPDVLEHVRSGGAVYYVPNDSLGPCRMVARIPVNENGNGRVWLRSPQYLANTFPTMIADSSFLDKVYRWDAAKAVPR